MKLIKSYISIISIIIFSLLIVGCEDNNDPELLFDDTPAVRIQKDIDELRNTLKSSPDGWKINYFTGVDRGLGGFTFLFNFLNNKEVIMDSDFGNPDINRRSLYDITLGSTVKLTFTTRNVLHELSDGANFPNNDFIGQGYRGDFEFLLVSYEGDDIIFKSNRNRSNIIRFTRATADDWTNLDTHQTIMDVLANSGGSLGYDNAGNVSKFNFDSATRYATNTDGTAPDFGIAYTPTGIIISPAVEVNGIEYSEFTMSADETKFTSSDGLFSIEIIKAPIDMSQAWLTAARPGFVPQAFIDLFTAAKTTHDATFAAFPLSDIFDVGGSTLSITFGIGGTIARHGLNFSGVIGDPTLLDVSVGAPGTNWQFVPWFDPMVNYIADNAPYQVNQTSPTRVELTSEADPTITFVLLIL
ncbi:DUF4302 domain-containing protein [Tenacibaculum agarivorans]|uniref:DUF4302 domain-containing protein n=1 Tax=Tenacibaculum agarivorans TaxID=1908389 RepID=UPI00094B8BD2|nr:DUF4302 domain-containing protein [Tenacibaculum agarivorans]